MYGAPSISPRLCVSTVVVTPAPPNSGDARDSTIPSSHAGRSKDIACDFDDNWLQNLEFYGEPCESPEPPAVPANIPQETIAANNRARENVAADVTAREVAAATKVTEASVENDIASRVPPANKIAGSNDREVVGTCDGTHEVNTTRDSGTGDAHMLTVSGKETQHVSVARNTSRKVECNGLSPPTPSAGSKELAYNEPCAIEHMNTWASIITKYLSLSTVLRTTMVCKDWATEAKRSRWLHACVMQGNVVGNEIGRLWRFCTKADEIEAFWMNYFHVKTSYEAYDFLRSDARHPEKSAEIDRDVPRTFPAHPMFQTDASRQSIQGVLRAISAANPKVGYCQGMNFVVAVFLMHVDFDEALTTWLVLALLKHYSYEQLFSPGVPLLPLRTFQFSGLIKKNLLTVYAHLQTNGFAVDIFSHQWMMTLFAYMIDPKFLGSMWNVIFLVGWKAIFQAGLGIMSLLQDAIMQADNLEDISKVVHAQRGHLSRLFNTAGSLPEALSLVFLGRKMVETPELQALAKEYILQKWDAFLTSDTLPPGFTLVPKDSEKPDLIIAADAFVCRDSPPWKRKTNIEDSLQSVNVSYDVYRRIRESLLEWDSVVKNDVEVYQRRIAAALRELQEFEKTHQEIQKDVVALEDRVDEYRQFKQTLIEALYATTGESAPHKKTVEGLSDKIIETERNYVEICDRYAAKEDEWTPLREELEELQMKKAMLVQQFTAFLTDTDRTRQEMLEASWDISAQ